MIDAEIETPRQTAVRTLVTAENFTWTRAARIVDELEAVGLRLIESTPAQTHTVMFANQEELRDAVARLTSCHPHHFDVRPDHHCALSGLSAGAVGCLLEDTQRRLDTRPVHAISRGTTLRIARGRVGGLPTEITGLAHEMLDELRRRGVDPYNDEVRITVTLESDAKDGT